MTAAVGRNVRSKRAHALIGSMLVLGAVAAACSGSSDLEGTGGQGGRATGGSGGAGSDAGDGGSPTGGAGGASAGNGAGGSDAGAGGSDAGAGGSDAGAGGSDAGAGGSDAGSPNGGASGVPGGTTIIDRPPRLEQDCTVVRPPTLLGVDWSGADLGVTANGAFILHVTPSASGQDNDLVLSSLDPDGTLETSHVETAVAVSYPNLHARPSGLSVAWRDENSDDIATTNFDADGAPTRAIRLIDAPSGSEEPRIIATDGGYALLTIFWHDSEAGDIQFTALDADGVRVRPPVTVYEGLFKDSGGIHSRGFIAVPGGFLAQFLHSSADLEDNPGPYILPLDEQGAVRGSDLGTPWDVARAMLALGDEFLAAFEVNKTRSTCVLGLGRLNLSTLTRTLPDTGVFETLPRMPWVTDCRNAHVPRLFTIGENVGLHWREPGVSRFVLLARDDLTPVSRVVTLPDLPEQEGTVIDVDVQALGSDILVVNTYSLPGMPSRGASSTISCRMKASTQSSSDNQ